MKEIISIIFLYCLIHFAVRTVNNYRYDIQLEEKRRKSEAKEKIGMYEAIKKNRVKQSKFIRKMYKKEINK